MGPVGTTAVPHFYTKKCAAARLSRSPPTGDPQVARTGFGLRAAQGGRVGTLTLNSVVCGLLMLTLIRLLTP